MFSRSFRSLVLYLSFFLVTTNGPVCVCSYLFFSERHLKRYRVAKAVTKSQKGTTRCLFVCKKSLNLGSESIS